MTADRIPPQSLDAEMAAIGSMLVDRDALDIVLDIASAGDFYAHAHELLVATIAKLHAQNKPIDKISLAEALRNRGVLERVGGLPYLNSIMDVVPTAASAEYYAKIVVEKSRLRGLIEAGGAIARAGFDGEADVDDAIAKAESAFAAAVDRGSNRSGATLIYDALVDNFGALLDRTSNTIDSEAVLTPFAALNRMIGPSMPGDLNIWAAAAKSGKTAALVQTADSIAAHHGDVAFVSLEMSRRQISMRLVALYGRVSVRRQREGDLTLEEMQRVEDANEKLKLRPLHIFDKTRVRNLADIRRELRLLSRTSKVRAIVIDGLNFLGDVDVVKGDRSTKNDRMDALYKSVIRILGDFGIVGHVAQHVNREGMSGPPSLRDIRDGGNPEGHASAVISPYRPHPTGDPDQRRQGEFRVLAAREGDSGTIDGMEFHGARSMWIESSSPRPWFESACPEEPLQMEAF